MKDLSCSLQLSLSRPVKVSCLKGNSTRNWISYVRIWAGEWRCESLSCQFSFVSDQEGTSMTWPDDDTGSQVAWPSPRRFGLDVGDHTAAGRSIMMRESNRELVSDSTHDRSIDRTHWPAAERSPTSDLVRKVNIHQLTCILFVAENDRTYPRSAGRLDVYPVQLSWDRFLGEQNLLGGLVHGLFLVAAKLLRLLGQQSLDLLKMVWGLFSQNFCKEKEIHRGPCKSLVCHGHPAKAFCDHGWAASPQMAIMEFCIPWCYKHRPPFKCLLKLAASRAGGSKDWRNSHHSLWTSLFVKEFFFL